MLTVMITIIVIVMMELEISCAIFSVSGVRLKFAYIRQSQWLHSPSSPHPTGVQLSLPVCQHSHAGKIQIFSSEPARTQFDSQTLSYKGEGSQVLSLSLWKDCVLFRCIHAAHVIAPAWLLCQYVFP